MLTAAVWAMLAGPTAEAPRPAVAVVSPSGSQLQPDLEPRLVDALEAGGHRTTRLQRRRAGESVCADSMVEPECVEAIRRRWTATQPPLMVLGSITADQDVPRVRMLVLHRDEPEPIARFDARFVPGDLVLPVVFPQAVVHAIDRYVHPPAPPTEQELAEIAGLDEPPAPPSSAVEPVSTIPSPRPRPTAPVVVAMDDDAVDQALHLRRDFDAVCRRGPRRRRDSRDDPRDLRPRCSLGPVLGYVRPRTWVMASLAIVSGVAAGVAFRVQQRGSFGEETLRKAGAWGTATAATSAVLGVGVVTLIIGDRWQARRYLRDERWLAAQ